ncbi:translocation/assembly module TamB domain-containing protein [Flavobacterium sp.]|uniref:translocation/assembly module TamB domain-containing protein n=1 Tax=Flavobacterium sp. TaxID=239 RepID=UPI0039E5B746
MDYKKYIRKTAKVLLWIIGSLIGLFLLVVLLIQVPAIQNVIKNKAVTYLEGKIHTKVVIGRIEIGLPKKVILEDFYFEDQQKDTLLAGEKLAVDISLFKLISNEVEINSVDLKGITANVSRNQDSVFNFDYIIQAFASKEEKEEPSQPMKISVKKINLDRVHAKFDDKISKNDLKVYLAHFDTQIDQFDLDKLEFDVPKIKLDGLDLKLKQGQLVQEVAVKTREVTDSLAQQPNLKLKLGTIDLNKIKIGYDNEGTKMNTGVAFHKMLIRVNNLDIQKQIIDLESLDIRSLKGALTVGKFERALAQKVANAKQEPETAPGMPWKIKLNQADFKRVAFRYNDQNAAPVQKGIDYQHLDIKNLNLVGEKFGYDGQTAAGNIYAFTVQDKSGLDIQSLKTEFYYGQKNAYLKKLYLKTPQTLLKDQIIVGYPSIESLGKDIGALDVNANVSGSHIGFKDILIFVPALADTNPFKSNPDAIMQIDSRITGKVGNLQIPKLQISGIGNTVVNASGRIIGLPDAEKAYFNLAIHNIQSTARDIQNFVPKGTIPNNIQLPSQLALNGTFVGYINDFDTNLNLRSSFGNAKVKAQFDQRRKNQEKYKADVDIQNFNVGKLLKNDTIGRVTLKAKVSGTGLDPKTANAVVKGHVYKAEYNNYTFRDLVLNGNIQHGEFVAEAKMKDPNLTFDLASSGDFGGKYPAVKLKLNMDIADLEKLNLHAGPMKIRGNVDADIQTLDADYLNGNLSLHHIMFANENGEFILDSINVESTAMDNQNAISLRSQFADADVVGRFQVTKVGTALMNSVAKYYNTSPKKALAKTDPQQFDYAIKVKPSPLLLRMIPDLKELDSIAIAGHYNSVGDTIVMNALIPKLAYADNTITNAVVNIGTENESLVYAVIVDDIHNPSFQLPYASVSGSVKDNTVAYVLQTRDAKDVERYLIAGILKAENNQTIIHLVPDGLRLNYDNWTVNPENEVRLGESVYVNQFELGKDGSSIKIQSQSEAPDAPMAVDFKEFKIETITSMVQQDSLLLGGRINGNAILKNLQKSPTFTADMNIDDFSYKKDTVGNINIKVNNEIANTYDAKVAITGNGNQVNLDGIYRSDNSSFDLNLDMQHLEMKSIQPFTAGNLRKSSGYVNGKLKVTGTVDDPNVIGEVKFNDGAFTVVPINSAFHLINDKILFTENGIVFEKFSLSDENDNELIVIGHIDTPNYRDYAFNLNINADNFRAMNSKEKDNDLYYGQVFLDTKLRVRGDLNKPVIDGNIKLNGDTKLTVVLPSSNPSIEDREGIVEFIDQDNDDLKKIQIANDSLGKTKFRGIDASVNIEIDKEAELNLIIDKGNGDYLKLKGEARLTGGIDPSGKTTLTGRYEFQEGTYEMTFNVLKRKFEIKQGSYILWTGEPTQADVNITAIYKSNTAPIDLVGDQLGGVPDEVRNQYKQRIPFETNLIMKGALLKPEITFDIQLEEGNNSVSTTVTNTTETKLAQLRQDPSELNKQVFALLLLNRFISENPFASEAGGTSAESFARQSASKLLSQQLNNLAADLIQGVEINFDLESTDDYTSGSKQNRTDLNVGVSRRFMNDRLKVTVGSSFGLEGQQQAGEETTNIAGDLAADYQLTKDGRYRVRVYRKNQYQVALQGQVIETGVGFIITMDYNKFRELFHRSEKEREIEAELKAKKEKAKAQKAKDQK